MTFLTHVDRLMAVSWLTVTCLSVDSEVLVISWPTVDRLKAVSVGHKVYFYPVNIQVAIH